MSYEWQAGWETPADAGLPVAYKDCLRAMIMASVNWLAEHPGVMPEWRERNLASVMRRAGVDPSTVSPDSVWFTGNWEDFIRPTNQPARLWTQAIGAAAEPAGGASFMMMRKAMACGVVFRRDGWDGFSRAPLSVGRRRPSGQPRSQRSGRISACAVSSSGALGLH